MYTPPSPNDRMLACRVNGTGPSRSLGDALGEEFGDIESGVIGPLSIPRHLLYQMARQKPSKAIVGNSTDPASAYGLEKYTSAAVEFVPISFAIGSLFETIEWRSMGDGCKCKTAKHTVQYCTN